MKIQNIKVYKINIPLKEGSYKWAHNNKVEEFDTSIVVIETDENIMGVGEVCTLGSSYLPAYSKGVRSGILEIGKNLIGKDPTNIANINFEMEKKLKGHPYVKSPIDMACWDILGKYHKMPLWKLLGGKFGEKIDLYRAISQEDSEMMKLRCDEWDPDWVNPNDVYLYWAIALEYLGKFDESEKVLIEGLEELPDNTDLMKRLAYSFKKQGKIEEMIIEYERLLDSGVKDTDTLRDLASALE